MNKLILILFLSPLISFSQTNKGKVVRNQSVKATSVWIDTLSFGIWLLEIKNMNNCDSDVQFSVEGREDTITKYLEPFEAIQILLDDSFVVKFRNGTSCAGGSMAWLYIDSKILADSIKIGTLTASKSISFYEESYYPIKLPDNWGRDSVATRVSQRGMYPSHPYRSSRIKLRKA
jgi:hypothetical protein